MPNEHQEILAWCAKHPDLEKPQYASVVRSVELHRLADDILVQCGEIDKIRVQAEQDIRRASNHLSKINEVITNVHRLRHITRQMAVGSGGIEAEHALQYLHS